MEDNDENTIAVYACDCDEMKDEKPIGRTDSKSKAARMINKFLSERDGYDPELKAANIVFSAADMAFLIDQ